MCLMTPPISITRFYWHINRIGEYHVMAGGGFVTLVVGTRPQLARLEVLLAVPIKDDEEDSTTCSTFSCSS